MTVASGQIFVVGYFVDDDMKAAATLDTFDVGLKPIPGGSDTIEILGAVETYAYGVMIDRLGDVVVVGSATLDNNISQGLVALYTPTGAQKWARILEPTKTEDEPRERLFGVSVDSDNHYVAVGKRKREGDKRRLWQVRIDAAGNELASTIDLAARCGDEDFEDDTEICGVAMGPLDRTHFAGVLPSGSDDYLVKRTKADWAVLTWETADDGPDHATDRGLAVAVDANGFVTSAGYHTAGGLPRWLVARQNP